MHWELEAPRKKAVERRQREVPVCGQGVGRVIRFSLALLSAASAACTSLSVGDPSPGKPAAAQFAYFVVYPAIASTTAAGVAPDPAWAFNADFKNTDVVIVVGANDVVNPAAREATGPIAGMPILDVDEARTVVVIKRSLAPGYAGIKNPLFERENCLMVFLDAKEALEGIVKETKELVK